MDIPVRARIRARRELTRQGFGPLYARLHQILLNHNPGGLDLTRGDARDDYGAPVGTLIPKLRSINEGDLARVLHIEMRHWYRDAAGTLERYDALAAEIWQAYDRVSARPLKLTHYQIITLLDDTR